MLKVYSDAGKDPDKVSDGVRVFWDRVVLDPLVAAFLCFCAFFRDKTSTT